MSGFVLSTHGYVIVIFFILSYFTSGITRRQTFCNQKLRNPKGQGRPRVIFANV